MNGSSCEIYADNNDLNNLFGEIEKIGPFKYIKMTSELNKDNACYYSSIELLKYATGDAFLVVDADKDVVSRTIDLIDGSGHKNRVDQDFNEDSICITLGGDIRNNTIIVTVFDTLGESSRAKEVFKIFKKTIMKNTKKVNRSRIMPSALEKLQNGWRLTQGETYSRELDVVL